MREPNMFKILLVDDSATDRILLTGLLNQHEHFEIDTAEDGAIALAKMQVKVPDLVVTDMQMPNLDGLQLVEKIRAHYPYVPVILVTGKGSEELASMALQRGAAGYVPKARCGELLQGTIEHVIELTRSESSFKRLIDSSTLCQFEYLLENDLTLIAPMLELAQRMCAGMKICDLAGCVQIGVALEHAILNAMVHGNLEIGSESFGDTSLLNQRLGELPYRNRKVRVGIRMTRDAAQFTISDEGAGFDVKELANKARDMALTGDAGRGLFLMWAFMDSINFDRNGNTVVMVKRRASPSSPASVAGTKKAELPAVMGILTSHDGASPISFTKRELRTVVTRLKELTSTSDILKSNEKEFTELLAIFRDQLAFRFEAFGCFEEAVEEAPQIYQQSQRLRDQYTELFQRAKKLVECASDSATRDLESLSKNTQDMLRDLEVHEAAETEMIMNTMFEDIGGSG